MKTALLPFLLALGILGSAGAARADAPDPNSGSFDKLGHVGVGIALEDFGTLATAKVYLPGSLALQAGVGLGYYGLFGFVANADLLYEFPRFVKTSVFSMNWYLGGGASVGAGSWTCPGCEAAGTGVVYAGGQGVGGVAMQFPKVHIEVVGEVRPTFLAGSKGYGFYWYPGGGVAGRYFF